MSSGKVAEIKVIIEHTYMVPLNEDGTTLNGWTVDELIKDWFHNPRHPIYAHHASRQAYEVGNSGEVKKARWFRSLLGVFL